MATALVERYRERLPLSPSTPIVTLGEGGTPLLPAPRLSHRLGLDIWLKWEGANPTGSFKDRGMAVALSKAVEEGAQAVICASTGNTAASAAAYAARAGLPALVLQPEGAVALGKLAQARAQGARLIAVRGSFDDALAAARSLAGRGTHALVNSLNPYRIEGQKTAAFEIVDELGAAPEVLALPYGGGGTRARTRRASSRQMPECLASWRRSRPNAQAQSLRRSASRRPCMRSRSRRRWRERGAESYPSPTMPSSRPGDSWHTRKGSFASPPPRLPSPRSQDPASSQAPASCA